MPARADQEPEIQAAISAAIKCAAPTVVTEGIAPEQAVDNAIARIKQILNEELRHTNVTDPSHARE